MNDMALAKRYAKALISLAQAVDAVDAVQTELDAVCQVLPADAQAALASPTIAPAAKLDVMAKLGEGLGLADLTRHFLDRLVRAGRIGALDSIAAAYRRLAEERAGVLQAQVSAAAELSDDQTQDLQQALEARTGQRVRMTVQVEPSLLAGAVVRVGNTVLDGSAQGRLRLLAERLTQGRVHEH